MVVPSAKKVFSLVMVFLISFLLTTSCFGRSVTDIPFPEKDRVRVIDVTMLSKKMIRTVAGVTYVRVDILCAGLGVKIFEEKSSLRLIGVRICNIAPGSNVCFIRGKEFTFCAPVLAIGKNVFVPARDFCRVFGTRIILPGEEVREPVEVSPPVRKAPFPQKEHKKASVVKKSEYKLPSSQLPDVKKIPSPPPKPQKVPPTSKLEPTVIKVPESKPKKTEMPHQVLPSRLKWGTTISMSRYQPDTGNIPGKNFRSEIMPGVSVFLFTKRNFYLSLRYEWIDHYCQGMFFNINEAANLSLKEQYFGATITRVFGRRKLRNLFTLGVIGAKVKLQYRSDLLEVTKKFTPLVFEISGGLDYLVNSVISVYLKLRYLTGEKDISLFALNRRFSYKLDDLFLELGTNFYFDWR